jgi:hypothetical protein
MQTELEKQEHDEAGSDTANKHVSDHLIGKLDIGNEQEIPCRRENR